MRILALVITFTAPLASHAAIITVNITADHIVPGDGYCTLREAVENANDAGDITLGDCLAGSGAGDAIVFDVRLPAAFRLEIGQLEITKDLSIDGSIPGAVRIDGKRAHRLFEIVSGTTIISNVTLKNGGELSADSGLRVDAGATLNLVDCGLQKSRPLLNYGTANLTNCTVSRTWVNNYGVATLTNCSVSRSRVYNYAGASIALNNSTLTRSADHQAIDNLGTATISNSTLSQNAGIFVGGVYNSAGATLDLTNSTLTANRARYNLITFGSAAAISNYGTTTVTNCTLSGNRATTPTIHNEGTFEVTNTILANPQNCSAGGLTIPTNRLISNGGNIVSNNSCLIPLPTDMKNTDPMLAPLADNGGPTKTMALCTAPGVPSRRCDGVSPAIDAGIDTVVGPPTNLSTDQRGLPRQAGLHVDVGAYEVQ